MAAVSAGSRKAGWSDSTSCRSGGNRTGDALVKMQVNRMPSKLQALVFLSLWKRFVAIFENTSTYRITTATNY